MLSHLQCAQCFHTTTSRPLFLSTIRFAGRCMSIRQAERLRRCTSANGNHASSTSLHDTTATAAYSAKKRSTQLVDTGLQGSGSGKDGLHPRSTRDYSKLTSSHTAKAFASTKKKSSLGPSNATASSTATSAAKASPIQGRFNRLVIERGFFFTVYLYVLGESITLGVAYLLQTNQLGVGEMGSWLAALKFPTDRFLNVGPTVYGLQLSPRLVLNYLAANVCTYPLLPLEMRFCLVTAPILQAPFKWIGAAVKKTGPVIPKAPSAKP